MPDSFVSAVLSVLASPAVALAVKRLIGKDYEDVQQDAARLAYTVSADEDGFAVVDCPNLEASTGGAAGLLAEWPGRRGAWPAARGLVTCAHQLTRCPADPLRPNCSPHPLLLHLPSLVHRRPAVPRGGVGLRGGQAAGRS